MSIKFKPTLTHVQWKNLITKNNNQGTLALYHKKTNFHLIFSVVLLPQKVTKVTREYSRLSLGRENGLGCWGSFGYDMINK